MAQDPQTSLLLREAEEVIVQLRRDNDACNDYIEELTNRLQMEVEHIRRLGEKIDKLEAVLSDVSAERDDVRIVLQSLRDDMQKIRDVAAASLKNAKDRASLMDMAVKFYDVKKLADERIKRVTSTRK